MGELVAAQVVPVVVCQVHLLVVCVLNSILNALCSVCINFFDFPGYPVLVYYYFLNIVFNKWRFNIILVAVTYKLIWSTRYFSEYRPCKIKCYFDDFEFKLQCNSKFKMWSSGNAFSIFCFCRLLYLCFLNYRS